MTEGMVQVQMLVPSLKTDATITATTSKANGLKMEIKSEVKLPETSSVQAVTFKYGMSVSKMCHILRTLVATGLLVFLQDVPPLI